MNITGLKIPTGGRHTSWLYTSMTEELNYRPLRNNSSLVVRAGLEPVTSGFQVRRPNHSATLPQVLRSNVEIVWPELEIGGPTMLGYVALRCCYRLAGLKNNNANPEIRFAEQGRSQWPAEPSEMKLDACDTFPGNFWVAFWLYHNLNYSPENVAALYIQPKFWKVWKRQMVQKYLTPKFQENLEIAEFLYKRTIQPKTLGDSGMKINKKEWKFPVRNFRKLWYTSL